MKILNFGSCNIDHVYSLDHITAPGETQTINKLETFPGGKGLNQSIAAAKAGAEVFHAGCVGFDGDLLTDILKENNVDISFLKQADIKNGHAVIQVDAKGQNSIFVYPGSNEKITKDYIDFVFDKFSSEDIVLLQNEISNTDYIVEKAYEKGMKIILNPSPINERIKMIDFSKLAYLILNEIEGAEISGKSSPEEILMWFKKTYPELKTVLTLGEKGSVYSDNSLNIHQPAFEVEAVDTTAAGDTFTGYFAAGIASGENYGEILKISSIASAIAVSRPGAAPSVPKRDEVLQSANRFKEKNIISGSDSTLKKINEYISDNLKSANINELSHILGYASAYTGAVVKKLTKMTFSQNLQEARLHTAYKMLSETDLSVKKIINDVGYENESFFRKMFKEKYGKSPLELRKEKK